MFDDLEQFMAWFLQHRPLQIPAVDALSFYETAVGTVLYRQPPFQVQFFTAYPLKRIAEHVHPNVDSFEVWLHGMEFALNGETKIELKGAEELAPNGMPVAYGVPIRVRPTDYHGGIGGQRGGAFLSIQKWLNGVHPTCVARDWSGDAMGPLHQASILTSSTLH